MNRDMEEVWEIFMGLCEDFPELYDKYVEKTEKNLKSDAPEFVLTEDDKKRAREKLLERIRNDC